MSKVLDKLKTFDAAKLERFRSRLKTDNAFRESVKKKAKDTLDSAQMSEFRSILSGKQITQEEADRVPAGQQAVQQRTEVEEASKASSFERALNFAGETIKDGVVGGLGGAGELIADVIVDPLTAVAEVATGIEPVPTSFTEVKDRLANTEFDEARALARDEAQKRSPNAVLAGRVAGEIGLAAAGGVAAKAAFSGVDKVAKVSNALDKASKLGSTIPVIGNALSASVRGLNSATVANEIVFSAANIQALKGNTDVSEYLEELGTQAMYMGIGGAIGSTLVSSIKAGGTALGKVRDAAVASADEFTEKTVLGMAIDEVWEATQGVLKKEADLPLPEGLKYNKQEAFELLENIPTYVENIKKGKTSAARTALKNAAQEIKTGYATATRQLDSLLKNQASPDFLFTKSELNSVLGDIETELMSAIKRGSSTSSSKYVGDVNQALEGMRAIRSTRLPEEGAEALTQEFSKGASLGDMNQVMQEVKGIMSGLDGGDLADLNGIFGKVKSATFSQARSKASVFGDEAVKQVDSLITADKSVRALNDFANLHNGSIYDITKEGASGVKAIFGVSTRSLMSGAGQAGGVAAGEFVAQSVFGLPPGVVLGVRAARAAGTVVKPLALKMARNSQDLNFLSKVDSVNKFFSGQSDEAIANSPVLKNLTEALGRQYGRQQKEQQIGKNPLSAYWEGVHGGVELKKSPLGRSNADFHARKEDIMGVLRISNPEIADMISSSLEQGDDIAPIMEKLASMPIAQEVVAPGIGWGGKTWDENTKASLKSQIDGNHLVPTFVKEKLIEDLAIGSPGQAGAIPNLDEVPIRKPKKSRNGI